MDRGAANQVISTIADKLSQIPIEGEPFRFVSDELATVAGAIRSFQVTLISATPDRTIAAPGYWQGRYRISIKYYPGFDFESDIARLQTWIEAPAMWHDSPIRTARITDATVDQDQLLIDVETLQRRG